MAIGAIGITPTLGRVGGMENALGAFSIIIIIAAGLSIFFATKSAEPVDERLACGSDSDCVPAGCCHPSAVINKNFAPDCAGTICTAVCEPDTLDCGQAFPRCINKRCGVVKTGVEY